MVVPDKIALAELSQIFFDKADEYLAANSDVNAAVSAGISDQEARHQRMLDDARTTKFGEPLDIEDKNLAKAILLLSENAAEFSAVPLMKKHYPVLFRQIKKALTLRMAFLLMVTPTFHLYSDRNARSGMNG